MEQRDILGSVIEPPAKVPRRDYGIVEGSLEDVLKQFGIRALTQLLVQCSNLAAHIGTISGGTVNLTVHVYQSEQPRCKALDQKEQ